MQMIELAFPAWAQEHDTPLMSGILLSSMAIGSVIGGLALGALPHRWSQKARFSVTLAALAVGTVGVAAASQTYQVVLLAATAVLGLALGPTFVALYSNVGDLAPENMAAETQSWISAFMCLGSAAGSGISAMESQRSGAGAVLLLAAVSFAAASALARVPALTRTSPVARAEQAETCAEVMVREAD